MSTSHNIVIRDFDTGEARTGLTVQYFNNLDNFTTAVHTAIELGGRPGVYQVTYDTWVNAKYKLKVNGSFDPAFGGDHGVWIIDGDNVMSLNEAGRFDAKNKRLINLANPVDDQDGVTKIYLLTNHYTKTEVDDALAALESEIDSDLTALESSLQAEIAAANYAQREENNTFSGDSNIFSSTVIFAGQASFPSILPLLGADPSNDNHPTRRSWVISQINNAAVPYQESVNVIRLMPEGTDQTNKSYNTWAKASNAARLLAGDLRRMTVEIKGAGTAGATIIPSDGGISGNNPFNSYVSYQGIHKKLLLELAGTENFTVTPRSTLISNLTIYCNDPDADITFTGVDFDNVKFDFADSSALTFDDCILEGCTIKVSAGTTTYTNSRGSNNNSNTDMGDEVGGFGGRNIDDL
jgi:hypothetical protein